MLTSMSSKSPVDPQTSQKIIEILDTATVAENSFINLDHGLWTSIIIAGILTPVFNVASVSVVICC